MSNDVFESAEYRRSRGAYCMECTFEYLVTLLVNDTFLAKLLTSIGVSDAMTGIISSFLSLACIFQLASIFVVRKIRNTKRFIVLFHTAGQLLFAMLYLVPLLPMPNEVRQPVAVLCILLAYFGKYFVTSLLYRWGNSFVDPHKRASYGAGKEMISFLLTVIIILFTKIVIEKQKPMIQ